MSEENDGGFTPNDINAFRLLALGLGIVTCVECFIVPGTEMLVVAIGLNVVTMIACPLGIYALRRARRKK